jgi:SPP1 gp7 family putative phage head morphogenesis protein
MTHVHNAVSPLRADPTRTAGLRRAFAAVLLKRFNRLRASIIRTVDAEDSFGLKPRSIAFNESWRYLSDPEKVRAFRSWLEKEIGDLILNRSLNELLQKYVEEGFKKGAGRAFTQVRGTGDSDFYNGSQAEFLRSAFGQPVAIEKVQLLLDRVFTDLKGVTDAMATAIQRALLDGLVQGKGPREIARDLAKHVDNIGKRRAELVARTTVISVHAEGQLIALKNLGVDEVGVLVEWLTAGDGRVCVLCSDMEGKTFTIEEASGKIPMHPACRCAFAPSVKAAKAKLAKIPVARS